jgi:ribosomal protein S27AE
MLRIVAAALAAIFLVAHMAANHDAWATTGAVVIGGALTFFVWLGQRQSRCPECGRGTVMLVAADGTTGRYRCEACGHEEIA